MTETSAPPATKFVYDFAEGSREHARPARRQGRQRRRDDAHPRRPTASRPASRSRPRPASPTWTPAARSPTASPSSVAEALARLEEAAGQAARRRGGPAARLGPLGRARVDAGDDGHGPQPGAERRLGRGARRAHRQRALRLGLLPPLRADVRQRRARRRRARRSRRRSSRSRPRAASRSTPSSTSTALRELTGRFKARFRARTGEDFPQDPREQLRQAIRAVFDSWMGERAVAVPPHQPHPRRLGHGGQRAADGLRQQGRDVGLAASRSAATR